MTAGAAMGAAHVHAGARGRAGALRALAAQRGQPDLQRHSGHRRLLELEDRRAGRRWAAVDAFRPDAAHRTFASRAGMVQRRPRPVSQGLGRALGLRPQRAEPGQRQRPSRRGRRTPARAAPAMGGAGTARFTGERHGRAVGGERSLAQALRDGAGAGRRVVATPGRRVQPARVRGARPRLPLFAAGGRTAGLRGACSRSASRRPGATL